ncbi:MAG: DUF3833 family protein [Ferruginibacter sp.]
MRNYLIPTLLFFFVLTGCTTLKPASFESSSVVLDPVKFFGGHTHSSGVLESPSGTPADRITTKTTGSYSNGILSIEQDLYPEKGKPNHRSFQLKLIDSHHVQGTGSDIAGTANGELYGNYFTWSFRLKIANKGLVKHVSMTQYMYLMPDGKTLIIRSVIRKFGMIVKEISEQFHKDD